MEVSVTIIMLTFSAVTRAALGGYTSIVCENEILTMNCLQGQSIKIGDVFYGRNSEDICNGGDNSKNVKCHSPAKNKMLVERRCNYRQSCVVPATNDAFTDPCLDTFKYLKVSYTCDEEPLQSAIACDGDNVEISCPEGTFVRVNSATYGRNKPGICNRLADRTITLTCQSDPRNVTLSAVNSCDGKASCSVPFPFGDPCPGVFKFLEVNYICLFAD